MQQCQFGPKERGRSAPVLPSLAVGTTCLLYCLASTQGTPYSVCELVSSRPASPVYAPAPTGVNDGRRSGFCTESARRRYGRLVFRSQRRERSVKSVRDCVSVGDGVGTGASLRGEERAPVPIAPPDGNGRTSRKIRLAYSHSETDRPCGG